jgi:signal transduction histidine kinase
VPIRLKLTLIFAGVMALLLAALSSFLYLHFRGGLDASINQALKARAGEIAGLVHGVGGSGGPRARSPLRGESFAQVLDREGRVLDASVGFARRALLSPGEVARARRRPELVERPERSRLYAVPIERASALVVVGVSLAQRESALETLNGALLIGGPLALLLASLVAYGLAAAALAPVESMRQRAATISSAETGARLPLPESVDEIYRLGSTLNEMLARLEAGLEHERAFVANASHELRTPLAILKAELEVALRANGSPSEMRAAVTSAAEEADRIVALAEGLLVLAHAEGDRLARQAERVPAELIVHAIRERYGAEAERRGRALDVGAGSDVLLDVDRMRIEQALSNLVDNALRYGEGTITVRAVSEATHVELHVTDEGPGFPPGFLRHAFERFSRADAARGRGGVGLGLAIAEAVAHAHHGEAGASNRPEGGADVWLALPRPRVGP